MKISLNSCTFALHYPLDKTIEKAANLGFRHLEVCGDRPHGWPDDINKEDRKQLTSIAESFDIKLESVCTGFIYYAQPGFAHPNPTVRKEGLRYVKQLIDLASDLNAGIVTFIPGRYLSNTSFDQAWKWSIENIRECVNFAKDKNIQLGLENLVNSNEFTNSSQNIIRMVNEINDKTLGVTVDLGHINVIGESFENFIQKLGDRIVNIHVDDNDGSGDAHLPPGAGNIDFSSVIQILNKVGYTGCLTLEVAPGWHWTSSKAESVISESKSYLDIIHI
jgi:sugar phosphate isomerase/epimerase